MKYTYEVTSRSESDAHVVYTAEVRNSPVIEKTVPIASSADAKQLLLAVVSAAPVREWAQLNQDMFPPKPPGTPSEFKVDLTQKPPQGAPV